MHQNIKIALVAFFGVLFATPHIASYFNINKIEKYTIPVTHDYHMPLTLDQWFKGRYQLNSNRYFRENYGLRNLGIRTQNQLDYWLFSEANAKDVIVGKEGYLFEQNYINSYLGINFLGENRIEEQGKKLERIQDTLAKLGKNLITIIAPGKGYFYPEFIPKNFKRKSTKTNYSEFINAAENYRLDVLDLNHYFMGNKGKTTYPLYGKNGIHWSYYGMCLATDTIIKHIEKSAAKSISHAVWDMVERDVERAYDYDIAAGMNLLNTLDGNKMGYPNIRFVEDSAVSKLSTIVIADSYYWGIYNANFPSVLGHSQFWYYNRQVYPDSYAAPVYVKDKNISEEIAKTDLFLIVCTEGNLQDFGWGIVEEFYSHFYGDH
jgi:hypothetical protein